MKTIPFVVAAVAILVGCGSESSDTKEPFSEYTPTIENPVEFILPAGSNTYQITQDSDSNGARIFNQSRYEHPEKWVIYLASAPWVTEGSSEFGARAQNDSVAAKRIMAFLEANDLDDQVDFVWMQYDSLPRSKAEGWGGMGPGSKIPGMLHLMNTKGIFDAYVISPAARFPGEPGLLHSEWIRPFIIYGNDEFGDYQRSFDIESGINDVNSKFWDRWGRHYFVVDPEGMVRDAYVSISVRNSDSQPMRSIVHHLGMDADDAVFPEFNPNGHYKAYYSPTLEGQFHDTMNLIDEGMRGE